MSMIPAPLSPPAAAPLYLESPTAILALTKRYSDAYRIANIQTHVGTLIKIVSGVIGAFILVISLNYAIGNDPQQSGLFGIGPNPIATAFGVLGSVVGIAIGGMGFVLGIIVSAIGQILKAILDSAVNSSPFLSNDQRARIMSL